VRSASPRLLLYGESLGAKVQEAAVPAGPLDLDHYGVSAALWVGTPGGSAADVFHALCAAESITVDRPEQIPAGFEGARPRVWFLEHDGDPVVRFRPELLRHRPAWLPVDGTRGRNVPESMTWKPGITWAQALVDTFFATNIKPGDFKSLGHDYRADLGAVVTAAYGLACVRSRSRGLRVSTARRRIRQPTDRSVPRPVVQPPGARVLQPGRERLWGMSTHEATAEAWEQYPTSSRLLAVTIRRSYGATPMPQRRRINEGNESIGAPRRAPHVHRAGRHRSRCVGETEAEGRA
jgi:hypothetical protein